MKKLGFAAVLVAALCARGVEAAPIVTVQSGPISLGAYDTSDALGALATPWTIPETFTADGGGILLFSDTDGSALGPGNPTGSFHSSGRWIEKTVTNNSTTAWTSFELELQEILGTPSGDGDGLSFAQGAGFTFLSSIFTGYTRIDNTRDYINFSGGIVPIGGVVTFLFAVTDNSPQATFYMNQIPNRVDVVPEPVSALLLGIGLAGIGYRARRRA